jgi:Ca2+-binding RTX toxin-like protein
MDTGTVGAGSFGNDYLAGGAGSDYVFGQLGNDVIQGDGSIDFISYPIAQVDGGLPVTTSVGGRVGAWRTPGDASDPTGPLTLYPSYEKASDGEDYVEGGGGNDVIFGGLGQDDLVGGSSSFFSLTTMNLRPDGADMIFGGAGTRAGRNDDTFVTGAAEHARDADTIVGDNGNIVRIVGTFGADVGQTLKYVTFRYDTYVGEKLIVRGVAPLDYTPGGPDFAPGNFGLDTTGTCSGAAATGTCSMVLPVGPSRNGGGAANGSTWLVDVGGNDEVHGESGDDTAYGLVGHDRLFGDGQDDDLVGGWGNDWISGGTGSDGILGDDGRIFTSRNAATGVTTAGVACSGPGTTAAPCFSEPLYGVRAFLAADPDTRTSQGNVLNEFIYTPGQVQTATINPGGALVKIVDLTPFNLTPGTVDQPLFDANNSDDVIFGGWADDFIHGGSGDDAIGGGEALPQSYIQRYLDEAACQQEINCATGLARTDFYRPWNPGDILHFGADTNPWHSNHHNASRLGEFLLYDEYDPRREILFYSTGEVWKAGVAPTFQYFLNESATEGYDSPSSCIQPTNQGCAAYGIVKTDGSDVIFGDLGNDWVVGGTGKDTIWGGWGNDLLNADDVLTTNNNLNDVPETHGWYEDRVYGGAGLDILIGNTGGDRLIDWVGEFNSYLVPFAPFGIATVSRQNEPQLPEFLYALSESQGADPTRTEDGGDAARNGEPNGELGLIRQVDHGLWQTQTGGPTDPQAGNIPGGRRDVLRGADFNNGSMQGFAADSGVFSVTSGALTVSATSPAGDAAAVFYSEVYLPIYYELSARVTIVKPTGGWKANAYVIFDYFSPTDFKFAGINQATNKLELGHRTAAGWIVDASGVVTGGIKNDTAYDLLVQVNGTTVMVNINGKLILTKTMPVRILDGETVGLNKGLVGFGSDNSRGVFDDILVQALPPTVTTDRTENFDTVGAFTGTQVGTWSISGVTSTPGTGRITGTPTGGLALATYALPRSLQPESYLELSTKLKTSGMAGITFDQYSSTDFKFAAVDVVGQRIVLGHYEARTGWVIDASVARTLTATTDYTIELALKGASVSVVVNGVFALSTSFNAPVVDGSFGVFGRAVSVNADWFRFRTNDAGVGSVASP